MIIQGRETSEEEIQYIRRFFRERPSSHRAALSRELAKIWDWRDRSERLKDMACRTFMLKLHRQGSIVLPPPLRSLGKRKKCFPEVPHSTDPVVGSLKEILPLRVEIVSRGGNLSPLFRFFLTKYHYLDYRGTVGKNMTCLVYDNRNRPLACMSFGAAAWKTRPRDSFIGWPPSARENNLEFIANNSRFLILPWVKVPRLASHLLGIFSRGIRGDWVEKYKHPVFLLETFVEKGRFKRTCYKAAGWRCLGDTTGSTRNRENNAPKAPVKEVNVYPPHRHFKELLLGGDSL